jgi:hypothetical protein
MGKMPYQIGQKLFAVHFKHRSATLQQFFYTQPFVFCDETPQVIKFLELQVVTRHTVRAMSEDRTKEPSHKGYILRDTRDHQLFACQYPQAAYSAAERADYNRFNVMADGSALADWLLKNPYDFYHLDAMMEKLREMITATGLEAATTCDASRLRQWDRHTAMVRFHNRVIKEFYEEFPDAPPNKFELISPKERNVQGTLDPPAPLVITEDGSKDIHQHSVVS